MGNLYLVIFITYYSIASFIFLNFLFNPNIKLTLVNKKTKKEKHPNNIILILYCLFWIISIPLSKREGEEQ